MTTFTKITPGALTPGSGTLAAPTTATWDVSIFEKSENDQSFRDLGLTVGQAKMLLVVEADYGDVPALGATVTLPDGYVYTVRNVRTVAPDGVTCLSYLAVSR